MNCAEWIIIGMVVAGLIAFVIDIKHPSGLVPMPPLPKPTQPAPPMPVVARPKRHHNFKPWTRHCKTGVVNYRCYCGAYYSRGPQGWTVHESPMHNRSCK